MNQLITFPTVPVFNLNGFDDEVGVEFFSSFLFIWISLVENILKLAKIMTYTNHNYNLNLTSCLF